MGLFGKANSISVVLDKPQWIAGETLKGTVYLHVSKKPIDCREAWVQIRGETTYLDKGRNSRSCIKHVFLDGLIDLPSDPMTFDLGNYKFPFEYKLPDCLPTSFDIAKLARPTGHPEEGLCVEYKAIALIKKKRNISAVMETDAVFSVLEVPPSVQGPISVSICGDLHTKSSTASKRSTCEISASLDKDVYAVGDSMQLGYQISNKSDQDIAALSISLHHRVLAKPSEKDGEVVVEHYQHWEMKLRALKANSSANESLQLKLEPSTLPSSSTKALLRLTYELQIGCGDEWCEDVKAVLPFYVSQAHGGEGQSTGQTNAAARR